MNHLSKGKKDQGLNFHSGLVFFSYLHLVQFGLALEFLLFDILDMVLSFICLFVFLLVDILWRNMW